MKRICGLAGLCAVAAALILLMVNGMHSNEPLASAGMTAQDKVSYVDAQIGELTKSEDYARLNGLQRGERAHALLLRLQEEGMISGVGEFDADAAVIAFVYADGTHGGIVLRDFTDRPGLPRNDGPAGVQLAPVIND